MTRSGQVSLLSLYDIFKMLIFSDADHKSTQNPTAPATYPVLYSDEYGKHDSVY